MREPKQGRCEIKERKGKRRISLLLYLYIPSNGRIGTTEETQKEPNLPQAALVGRVERARSTSARVRRLRHGDVSRAKTTLLPS